MTTDSNFQNKIGQTTHLEPVISYIIDILINAQNFDLKSKLFFCLKNIVQKIKLVRNYQNSQKLSKWLKNVEMVKKYQKGKKIKMVENCQNSQKLSKLSKIVKIFLKIKIYK